MNSYSTKYWKISAGLLLLLLLLVFYDLSLGSYTVGWTDIWNTIFNYNPSSPNELTVHIFRIPRVITGVLAGIALSVAGLLMQTLFQNPLAGPYVLGINSGASLFVALGTMFSFYFVNDSMSLVTAAMIGALLSGLLILSASIYVKRKVSLLLVGIMLGSFIGALISVIQAYADPHNLKTFILWSFGSLQGVEFQELGILTMVVMVGVITAFLLAKPLNLLLLGEKNATILGMRVKQIRFFIILVTAILTGVITAFCGPIAFVGLVVPNLVKMVYKTTNHFQLIVGSVLGGALLVVICDILMQLFSPFVHLPLNALTSLVGAPVVIWVIIRKF